MMRCALALTAVVAVPTLPGQQPDLLRPVAPADPSPRATGRYEFGWSEAVSRVTEKLRGSTTQRAWHFSKLVLARSQDDEIVRAVTSYLEKHLLTTGDDAPARNAIEVMRRSKNKAFSRVLLRAAGHRLRTLREEALKALETCADNATIAALVKRFPSTDLRTQALIIRCVARRWASEPAIEFLRRVIEGEVTKEQLGSLRFQVLQTFEDSAPAAVIAGTLAGNLGLYPESSHAIAAKQLHVAGSEEGRRTLLRLLEAETEPIKQAQLVGALAMRDVGASRDVILARAATAEHPALAAAIASALGKLDGDNVVAAHETLAYDDSPDVRAAAVEALHGRSEAVTGRLLSDLRTATGSKLRATLQLIVKAGDGRAVPVIVKRLNAEKGAGKRMFIQALGRLRHPAGVAPLLHIFLSDPVLLTPEIESVSYAAILLTNIAASEAAIWRTYEGLEADRARRSHLLKTLANLAQEPVGDADGARRKRIYARFRAILFDARRPAADRFQVLHYLKPDLTFDDAIRLKRLLKRGAAAGPEELRGQLNDFLWEFF